jgi:hypothetical protein
VTKDGIPQVTLNEIKRLGDTGISRFNNVDAFLVGAAANSGVERQLKAIGLKSVEVEAPSVPELANKVDRLYGSIENPHTAVADIGNGMENVMVGSTEAYQYLLPATHWVAHTASGLLWVTKDSVPPPTIDALRGRNGHARIYLFGGPQQISAAVARQLAQRRRGRLASITKSNASPHHFVMWDEIVNRHPGGVSRRRAGEPARRRGLRLHDQPAGAFRRAGRLQPVRGYHDRNRCSHPGRHGVGRKRERVW